MPEDSPPYSLKPAKVKLFLFKGTVYVISSDLYLMNEMSDAREWLARHGSWTESALLKI